MDRLVSTHAYNNDTRVPLLIKLGGTGVAVTSEAANALGAVGIASKAIPDGVASLNSHSYVPAEQLPFIPGQETPGIDGTHTVYAHNPTLFDITNFDTATQYDIAATHGAVSIVGDKLRYVPLDTPGTDVVTINQKIFGVIITDSIVGQPFFTLPTANGIDIKTRPNFIVDCLIEGFQDTVDETILEIATDIDFLNIIETVNKTTGNKKLISLQNELSLITEYYVRVKFIFNYFGTSVWSEPLHFTTTSVIIASQETQIIETDITNYVGRYPSFGSNSYYSDDGELLFISDFNSQTVSIYNQVNNLRNLIGKVSPPDFIDSLFNNSPSAYTYFGTSIALSADKQYLFISAPGAQLYDSLLDQFIYNTGIVFIYALTVENDYSSYQYLSYITRDVLQNDQMFGKSLSINPNNHYLYVGSPSMYLSQQLAITEYGFFVYDVSTPSLPVYVTQIEDPAYQAINTSAFGARPIKFSNDGLTMIVSDSNVQTIGVDPNTTMDGIFYILSDITNSGTFTLDTINYLPFKDGDSFGYIYDISPDGNLCFIDHYTYVDAINNYGKSEIIIFEKTNNAWDLISTIDIPESDQTSELYCDVYISTFAFNNLSTVCYMGTPEARRTPSDQNYLGSVYIYHKVGNSWELYEKVYASDAQDSDSFGEIINYSDAASELVVSSPYASPLIGNGKVYIFK